MKGAHYTDSNMFLSTERGEASLKGNSHFCDRNRAEDEMIDRVDKVLMSRGNLKLVRDIEARPDLMAERGKSISKEVKQARKARGKHA